MKLLRSSALALVLAGTAISQPARAADPELTVFDWAGFEEPAIWQGYVDKNGDAPTFALYGDDDEAYQKLASGFKADVAHPCAQMVSKYRDAGLIEPWDVSKIPAFDTIAPQFLNSPIFKDDKGVWYIPTDWGATAIAYNTETVPAEDVASLNVFIDPKYQGRTSLPDSADDVWALAYLATGVTDWTKVTDEQFQAAADWLRKAHQNVNAYWADPAQQSQLMASGAVDIAWSWQDAVVLLQNEGYPVGFQRAAKEGSSTFFCGFINLKDGPGKEDKAYDFINSLLAPTSAPALLDGLGYALSNDAAMATIPTETLKAHYVDPVSTTILAQTPIPTELRTRMIDEFEAIKAGF